VLSPAYANDRTLLAGTESCGLYGSLDGGQTWMRLGGEAVAGAVNELVLSAQFPAEPHILAIVDNRLLVSRDAGHSWSCAKPDFTPDQDLSAVAAPEGLHSTAPLLVGLAGGSVLRV
jgi:photosystem II stability/assembly factor-like uncharacterized protein